MQTLADIKSSNVQFSLEELAAEANRLLPYYLPEELTDSRMREEVNARLIRHLTTLGVVEEPLRQGREARYTYRHLVELLVARRLMAEGYTAAAVKKLVAHHETEQLESLLNGSSQVQVEPNTFSSVAESNPALEYLTSLRQARSMPPAPGAAAPSMPSPGAPSGPRSAPAISEPPLARTRAQRPLRWIRLEILPGLELHVREDFTLPPSRGERETLMHRFLDEIKSATNRK